LPFSQNPPCKTSKTNLEVTPVAGETLSVALGKQDGSIAALQAPVGQMVALEAALKKATWQKVVYINHSSMAMLIVATIQLQI